MSLVFPPLYAIMDAVSLRIPGLPFAQMLTAAGVKLIQYRHKTSSPGSLFPICRELSQFARRSGVRFVVNDRPDLACLVGAGGVHVGQEDLLVADAREICGPGVWVGISTHSLEQVREADATSADYIALGPIFETTTKAKPDPVIGVDLLRQARKLTRKPLVAIGGITAERAAEVYAAGADSLAVAGDLVSAADPAARAQQYLEIAARARHSMN